MTVINQTHAPETTGGVNRARGGSRLCRPWTITERKRLIALALASASDHELALALPDRSEAAIKTYRERLIAGGSLPYRVGKQIKRTPDLDVRLIEASQGATNKELAQQFGCSVSTIERWKRKLGLIQPRGSLWTADDDAKLLRNLASSLHGRSASAIDSRIRRLIARDALLVEAERYDR